MTPLPPQSRIKLFKTKTKYKALQKIKVLSELEEINYTLRYS